MMLSRPWTAYLQQRDGGDWNEPQRNELAAVHVATILTLNSSRDPRAEHACWRYNSDNIIIVDYLLFPSVYGKTYICARRRW